MTQSYQQHVREGQIELARVLFTETRMSVTKIEVEVGIGKDTIWRWARDLGWSRPAKDAVPKPLRVSPAEYRRRWLREERILPASQLVTERPVKDPFDMTDRAAAQDATEKHRQRLDHLHCRAVQLWNDGVGLEAIAVRVSRTEGHVRAILKRAGVDLKAPRHRRIHGKLPHRYRMTPKAYAGNWQRRT